MSCLCVKSQDTLGLRLHFSGDESQHNNFSHFEVAYSSEQEALQVLPGIISGLWGDGYLASRIDSLKTSDGLLDIYFQTGPTYKWGKLTARPDDEPVFNQAGLRNFALDGQVLQPAAIEKVSYKILRYLENNGYPFASMSIRDIHLGREHISGELAIEKGPFIVFDTLIVIGDAKISTRYLQQYLDIVPGAPYSEMRVKEIKKRIRDLPFVNETEAGRVFFLRDKARVMLHLKSMPGSRFDFIIGVLPNSNQVGGKLLITGEASMRLINPFGGGKSLWIDWKGLQPRSPQLNARFTWPFFMSMPIGLDLKFDLDKRDTFYLDIKQEIGFQYLLSGANYLKAFYKTKATSLIKVDTLAIIQSQALPPILDVKYSDYGLELFLQNLDYQPNPRKGVSLTITGSAGNKSIKRNSIISGIKDSLFDYSVLYDSIANNNLHIEGKYDLQYFLPAGRRSTLRLRALGGLVHNNRLLQSELFRLGGYYSLRGFDEEIIEASLYQVAGIEFRYLLSRNSFFSLFWDGAYVVRKVFNEPPVQRLPFGFGTGLAFNTKAGIFNLNYALGKPDNNPIQFKNAKIHFGYVGLF